jgi:hypothetical protein
MGSELFEDVRDKFLGTRKEANRKEEEDRLLLRLYPIVFLKLLPYNQLVTCP